MKKIVITGGAGFIGSFVVSELLNEDVSEVVIYDNQLNILALSSANDSQIPVIPKYEDIENFLLFQDF